MVFVSDFCEEQKEKRKKGQSMKHNEELLFLIRKKDLGWIDACEDEFESSVCMMGQQIKRFSLSTKFCLGNSCGDPIYCVVPEKLNH